MRTRAQLAAAQIAVFVGGGVLGPVAHMAWHRPGHSHGPGGQAIALRVEAHERPPHDHARAHDGATSSGDIPTQTPSPTGDAGAEPLDSTHGHGSLAHFGLALLSAPPPLALPIPEPAGFVARSPHPRVAALFQPSFPLPRPPPRAVIS